MKTTCKNCQCCYAHHEVDNAHTVFETKEGKITFSSIDDNILGIDVCQVCHKPPFLAHLWHKTFGQHSPAKTSLHRDSDCKTIVHTL